MLKTSLLLVASCVAVVLAHHEIQLYFPSQPYPRFIVYTIFDHTTFDQPVELRAITKLEGQGVQGNITFTQLANGKVHVLGSIFGLPQGQYGFHVHEKGDITGGCLSTGSHFNPEHKEHGHPNDENRHVGDLGNVAFDEQLHAHIDFVDSKIALVGPHCILGRAVVVHEKEDDFGRSSHPDSRKTGNAGGRVACGVIGLLDPVYGGWKTSGASATSIFIPTMLTLTILSVFV